ncbi:MAG: 4-hydroxythreonine-4-phosphate dehydrogenase PdxA [Deltaproteobacteria bacterium]|nr:MAG: 4-hydroxythreonine-4-phosphate dehydrogenase PdxA [Deltaproteobacteria bacterium]
MALPLLGITMGDPAGVGPEVIIKALSRPGLYRQFRPLVLGDPAIISRAIKLLSLPLELQILGATEVNDLSRLSCHPGEIPLIPLSSLDPKKISPGHPDHSCGEVVVSYLKEAVKLARKGRISAIVTAPISKEIMNRAGYHYPGHTELLAELTNTKSYAMMLTGRLLKVVLATIHCPLEEVAKQLSRKGIARTIELTSESLRVFFGIARPRIGVAALNPHAGEGGLLGAQELRIIKPAVRDARQKGIEVNGPLPADSLFYFTTKGQYDAIICMYHDQGLIPLKMLHFTDAVNVTLGLPIIRTSVDHGTAYGIAGRGVADPASMIAALKLAARMARIKKKNTGK